MSLPQQAFIDRLTDIFRADERVRGLWLTGSFGSGDADEHSDIDTTLVLAPEHLDDVRAGWAEIVAPLGETLLRRSLTPPGDRLTVVNHIYPGWLRWDAVLTTPTAHHLIAGRARAVFDRDGLALHEPGGASSDDVRDAVLQTMPEEFWRSLGLLPVVLARGDLLGARLGAEHHLDVLARMLKNLDEQTPTGLLHFHRSLTPAHYDLLVSLPPLGCERGSIVAFVRACTDALTTVLDELAPGRDRRLEEAALARVADLIPEWST